MTAETTSTDRFLFTFVGELGTGMTELTLNGPVIVSTITEPDGEVRTILDDHTACDSDPSECLRGFVIDLWATVAEMLTADVMANGTASFTATMDCGRCDGQHEVRPMASMIDVADIPSGWASVLA